MLRKHVWKHPGWIIAVWEKGKLLAENDEQSSSRGVWRKCVCPPPQWQRSLIETEHSPENRLIHGPPLRSFWIYCRRIPVTRQHRRDRSFPSVGNVKTLFTCSHSLLLYWWNTTEFCSIRLRLQALPCLTNRCILYRSFPVTSEEGAISNRASLLWFLSLSLGGAVWMLGKSPLFSTSFMAARLCKCTS